MIQCRIVYFVRLPVYDNDSEIRECRFIFWRDAVCPIHPFPGLRIDDLPGVTSAIVQEVRWRSNGVHLELKTRNLMDSETVQSATEYRTDLAKLGWKTEAEGLDD